MKSSVFGLIVGALLLGLGIYFAVIPGDHKWVAIIPGGLGIYMIVSCLFLFKK